MLANSNSLAVVSVGYRLAPENQFPAGPNDGIDFVAWLNDNAKDRFGAPLKFVSGEVSNSVAPRKEGLINEHDSLQAHTLLRSQSWICCRRKRLLIRSLVSYSTPAYTILLFCPPSATLIHRCRSECSSSITRFLDTI